MCPWNTPEKRRAGWKRWADRNRERLRAQRRQYMAANRERFREHQRKYNRRVAGHLEEEFYPQLLKEFPKLIRLDYTIPDGYDPISKIFVEIKTAKTRCVYRWRFPSKFFPGLWFAVAPKDGRQVDQQIIDYPKPLRVIVYDNETMAEIARRDFT